MFNENNSLNYSILKFDVDIGKVQKYCLKNYIKDSRISINDKLSGIENHLGFSLSDDDARQKLDQLSKIIRIPDILYQFVA